MAELYVNVNGTWKTASNYYINVNGTWKEGSELHAKVSSAWKQSSSSSSSPGPDVDDVFDAYLYTGNGLATSSNRAINVGMNLATDGGLVWIKNRSQTSNHVLQDTARGAGSTKRIASNDDDYENQGVNASTGGHISSFTSTGFELNNGSATTNLEVNNNNDNYVAWVFKKTAGFFDIQTYTGNGSNRTISHSLGSVPGAIWIKNTSEAGNWICYHRQTNASNAEDYYLILNSKTNKTDDDTIFNDTAPTSSVFSLGSSNDVNKSGATYVAYIFAHNDARFGVNGDEAIIQCGSYTGSSAPNTVTIGWEPQWILFKNTVNTDMNWRMYDAARGIPVGNDPRLMPNSTNAEDSNYDKIDITSTGFTLDLNNNDMNQHGVLHTYIAIRKETSDAYGGTSGIVTTNIVLDLNATNSSSYGGSGTTWSNLASSSYDATLVNGVSYSSNFGGTLVFDGTNDYAEITSASGLGNFSGDFTIEFWWKGPNQGGYQTIVEHYETGSPQRYTVQTADANNYLRVDQAFLITTSGVPANNNDWHHHVISRVGSTITYYIDTTSVGTATNSSDVGSSGDTLRIGAYSGNGYRAEGSMPQLRIYDGTGLTASNVLTNYNATKSNYLIIPTNLILHLDAGNSSSYSGSGTTWTDLSGNNHDGTLTNGATFNDANNGSIVFDGSNDYVNLGTQINSDIELTDVTISFWARIDGTTADEIFVSMESLALNTPLIIYYDTSSTYNVQNTGTGDVGGGSTNTIDVIVTDSSSEKRFTTSNNALNANQWYNIAVVLDVTNNTFYTYIDGVEEAKWVSNNTSGGIKSTTNNFRIGGGSPYLDGRIAQFLTYDKALTATEILHNYNVLKDRYS